MCGLKHVFNHGFLQNFPKKLTQVSPLRWNLSPCHWKTCPCGSMRSSGCAWRCGARCIPVGFMALGVPHHWLFIVYYVRNKLEALPLMLDDFSIPYFESYEWVLMRIKSTISEKNAGNYCGRKQTYSYSQKMKLQDDFCFGTSNWWFFEADGLEVILEDWEGSELQRMHYWKICKDYMAWTEFPGAGK